MRISEVRDVCFISARELQQKLNEAGATRIPVLFAVDFDKENALFIEHPLPQSDILFRVGSVSNITDADKVICAPRLIVHPEPYESYVKKFKVIQDGLKRGDSYLVNLTVRTPVASNCSLREIALSAASNYLLYVPERFVCFSPERFVKMSGDTISTNPMKGTISDSIPDAATRILDDPKEAAEHATIVDLMRNDLGVVAENIVVNRYRYIDRIPTDKAALLQVSSEITGRLPKDWKNRMGDFLFSLLPAGSITGAPKPATVNLIKEAEDCERGFYTGIFGYFDGESLDTAVLIRFIAEEHGQLYFHSGGGITANSNPEKEYHEVIEKIYVQRGDTF